MLLKAAHLLELVSITESPIVCWNLYKKSPSFQKEKNQNQNKQLDGKVLLSKWHKQKNK